MYCELPCCLGLGFHLRAPPRNMPNLDTLAMLMYSSARITRGVDIWVSVSMVGDGRVELGT